MCAVCVCVCVCVCARVCVCVSVCVYVCVCVVCMCMAVLDKGAWLAIDRWLPYMVTSVGMLCCSAAI